jgi:hypothetical protein
MNWKESQVAKGRLAKWVEPSLGAWNILWDNSGDQLAELVATKDGQFVYLRHTIRVSDIGFNSLSDYEKTKHIANQISFFDDAADFRSWVETRGNDKFRNIVV